MTCCLFSAKPLSRHSEVGCTQSVENLLLVYCSFWTTFTDWGRVTHICVSLSNRLFRQWLVACSAPNHYLKQYCVIVNFSENFIEIRQCAYRKMDLPCRLPMPTIMSQPQYVHQRRYCGNSSASLKIVWTNGRYSNVWKTKSTISGF